MRALLIVAALWAISAPLCAQAPTDYEAAVTARYAGDPQRAIDLLDVWLAEHPRDSDALVQRGLAYLALQRRASAAQDFRLALEIAPDYTDAREGLARAERQDVSSGGSYLMVGGAWSELNRGATDWAEVSLDAATPVSRTTTLGGRVVAYRRFGLNDLELMGNLTVHPSDNLWLRLSAGGTPAADFRPRTALAVGADYRIVGGANATVLSFDTSHQRFPLQEVVTVNPGIVQYFADGQLWATLRGIGTLAGGGRLQVGGLGRLDYAPRERYRYFVGFANGPDTELGVVTRVSSMFGGAEFPLGDRLSIIPSVAHEWRENGSERTDIRLDLKAVF
jgi:YaiO family outer membrane protein